MRAKQERTLWVMDCEHIYFYLVTKGKDPKLIVKGEGALLKRGLTESIVRIKPFLEVSLNKRSRCHSPFGESENVSVLRNDFQSLQWEGKTFMSKEGNVEEIKMTPGDKFATTSTFRQQARTGAATHVQIDLPRASVALQKAEYDLIMELFKETL